MDHSDHVPPHSPRPPSEQDPSHLPVDPDDGVLPGSIPNDPDQDGVIDPPR